MTIKDYIIGSIRFKVDEGAVDAILVRRGVDGAQEYQPQSVEGVSVELLRADLMKWVVLGPSRESNTSDSDNGWSHSEGGYTLDAKDKKLLIAEANAIYKAEDEMENMFGRSQFRIISNGVMPALRTLDGRPIPRIEN